MAPNESAILKSYLLTPSQLPTIISLSDFAALFPKSQQGSPQIRALYRDLQRQRNAVVDSVSANIEVEVARGKVLRREAARARREAGSQDDDPELELERSVCACSIKREPAARRGSESGTTYNYSY